VPEKTKIHQKHLSPNDHADIIVIADSDSGEESSDAKEHASSPETGEQQSEINSFSMATVQIKVNDDDDEATTTSPPATPVNGMAIPALLSPAVRDDVDLRRFCPFYHRTGVCHKGERCDKLHDEQRLRICQR
jgi:hypothetical protein